MNGNEVATEYQRPFPELGLAEAGLALQCRVSYARSTYRMPESTRRSPHQARYEVRRPDPELMGGHDSEEKV